MLHAALFLALLSVAAQRPEAADTITNVPISTKFVYVVRPGPGSPGGEGHGETPPRMAPPRTSAPMNVAAPVTLTNTDPPPVAAVPVITAEDVDVLPGAATPIDGASVGKGQGPGVGTGRGPGNGPGETPGVGDVYMPGVGGVSEPTLIFEVKPNFTVDAMRAKIEGVVVMEVDVLANGTVDPRRIRITRSLDPGLDREAAIAVRQWRFRPSLLLGQPVASRVIVELAFTLR